MRNRDLLEKKLSNIEGILLHLKTIVKTQKPLNEYLEAIGRANTLIEESKSLIEREPLDAQELKFRG